MGTLRSSRDKPLAGTTVAVVNLPHAERLIRRYMCTYRSPYFCFPPHDLLQVAACIREWTGARVVFLDAIAENLDEPAVATFLQTHQPAVMVALLGVESVATDLTCASALKHAVPDMDVVVFGYYATQYPDEILKHSDVDVVLRGDPEASCCAYLEALARGDIVETIPGVACRGENGRIRINDPAHLDTLDALPFPDYGMATMRHYNEMLLGGPFAAIQTSRGCPFTCSYCTSPQDRRLIMRKPERVVDELEGVVRGGARVVRFLDDTFTFDPKRVIVICQEIIRRGIRVAWSCLSRVDTLNAEALQWMKRAGCVRVVVGVESYSPQVLDALGKRMDAGAINERLGMIRAAGIEAAAFIIVGGPFESEEDFELTRQGLLDSPLDLIIVDVIALYGGAALTQRYQEAIEFQLVPYISRWRDPAINAVALERERLLYRQFYLRPRIIGRRLWTTMRFPTRSFRLLVLLLKFMITPYRRGDRHDLF